MTDTVPDTALVTDRAPEAFGIAWEYSRAVRGGRRIYIAAGETGAFADAYRRCRAEMRDLGYSYAEPYLGDSFTGTRPCFWMDEARGWSPAALEAVRALVPVRIAESAAKEAEWAARDAARRQEAEARAAREAEAEAGLIERAKTEAARSLGSRRWSWVRPQDIEEAETLIANPALDVPGARRLLDMVRRAAANVLRTEERVAVAHEPELALARDPAVRAAAAEALAHVTAFDADRARVRNDVGWSRATTLAGHVLTGMGDLDEAAASHAIRIIRIHHGQVPQALLARVLGAPVQVAA
ncbi:hypothetical protein OKC48_07215 [Methylorubrum extorquens]|uniref:hypothetical protein n=1 Tax=Methylorubrum extorquens TaxID=408 RepID=UPI002237FD2E|nr:hypothetical protein [Methylorubrum extorquens]UYW28296.1 hypothetical protein OKC48_07215 [Methylorubrum extorquens]